MHSEVPPVEHVGSLKPALVLLSEWWWGGGGGARGFDISVGICDSQGAAAHPAHPHTPPPTECAADLASTCAADLLECFRQANLVGLDSEVHRGNGAMGTAHTLKGQCGKFGLIYGTLAVP